MKNRRKLLSPCRSLAIAFAILLTGLMPGGDNNAALASSAASPHGHRTTRAKGRDRKSSKRAGRGARRGRDRSASRGRRRGRYARSRRGRQTLAQDSSGSSARSTPAGIPAERVTEIQKALIKMGYLSGPPSGQYDDGTVEAMKQFQSANQLPATGLPSAHALKRLGVSKRSADGYAVPVIGGGQSGTT